MNFSQINSKEELAFVLNIDLQTLTRILYIDRINTHYHRFDIPKKNSGHRNICAPSDELKSIQKNLSKYLWEKQKLIWQNSNISPNISHAFQKDKSIITNAKIHRNKKIIINLDLKNFFETIHFGRVCGFFEKNKNFNLPHNISIMIAQIACYNGHLPQGAPSSPIIANMICQILDIRLLKIAKKYKTDYTRYADDLTFSTNDKQFIEKEGCFLNEVANIINRSGFEINEKKTRITYKDSKQVVTGLVVNSKINADIDFIKSTRAMANNLYRYGTFYINGVPGTINQLQGRFSFINQLDKHNNGLSENAKRNSYTLNSREKQYRKFLFYKYFIQGDNPLIITEGKTDIRYIKAALKKYYIDYPNLIEKRLDGTFKYKIQFFTRPKSFNYLFGTSKDGADSMKVLFEYFIGKNNKANYFEYFKNLNDSKSLKSIIFLFDNETQSNRPLKKFLSTYSNFLKNKEDNFKKDLYTKLLDGSSNVYIATNPLKEGMQESEMEDLFTNDFLKLKLSGKTFSKNDKYDKEIFYGKNTLSNYVLEHYEKIDMEGFKPLLNAISEAIKSYN